MAQPGSFPVRYGSWAVVAGGSEGLGAAFAEQLAESGLSLVLCARRAEILETTAARLRAEHGVEVRTVVLDLSREDAPSVLMAATAGLDVGLLVCDAALAYTGPFLDQDFTVYRNMLAVNCASFLGLVHGYGRRFAARKKGGIVIMSSMAAFHGSPMVAVYSATKSFLLTLAEGVGAELAAHGVDVVACCPSVVLTPHFLSDGHNPRKVPLSLQPAFVAREALRGLGRKRIVVPSVLGRFAHFFMSRLLPRAAAVAMIGRNTRAMYGE